jgi:hypothetical protein
MGMGPLHLYTTSPQEAEDLQRQQYEQQFGQSAYAPIPTAGGTPPGLLSDPMSQSYTPQQWHGLLPAGRGNQIPQQAPARFAATGPYGNQAASMAGLLPMLAGNNTPPSGLLGGRRGTFRPGGK